MLPPLTFPLSPLNRKRALILLALYGILVITSAVAYLILSGDRRLPIHFILLFVITCVSAWGIHMMYRWAWAIATLFAAWQIYSGISIILPLFNAGVIYAPAPAQIVFGTVALRTVVLVILFLLLLFFSDRKNIFG